jgi:hypothetical protein
MMAAALMFWQKDFFLPRDVLNLLGAGLFALLWLQLRQGRSRIKIEE